MASGDKLRYCLNSLVNQTYSGEYEIIAVDDCSTDESLSIIRDYEKKYPGKVIGVASPENRHQGGARNLGLKVAKGQFIGFMDADDWAIPDMFESMISLAVKTGADAVGVDMCRVNEHTMIPGKHEACNTLDQTGIIDDRIRRLLLNRPGPLVTKIYDRHVFYEPILLFPENIFYEDNAVGNEVFMRVRHYEHIPEVKYFYYQHQGSTTHTITRRLCEDRMEAMRIMMKYAEKNGSLVKYHEDIEWSFTNMFYRNTLFSYMQSSIHKEIPFLRMLGKEMLQNFPNFRNNAFYIENVDKEQKKLINMQLKSSFFFVVYYKLLYTYRLIRYGK